MTSEQIERNRAFIEDLRANNGKECRLIMRHQTNGTRCCLAVAEDTAIRLGFVPTLPNPHAIKIPNIGIADFYGWSSSNPQLLGQPGDNAAARNDFGFSHSSIANMFEETFPEIKPPPLN